MKANLYNAALIVAAGSGKRAGQDVPKQYAHIKGHPMLRYSALSFLQHDNIDSIYVVIGAGQEEQAKQALDDVKINGYIIGGETRQQSVLNGLAYISKNSHPDNILVHDAARPFLKHDVIDRILISLRSNIAAIPIMPISDSIAYIDDNMMRAPADRDKLGRVQTPQGFHFEPLFAAHKAVSKSDYGDDAQIMHASGHDVSTITGDEALYKYTYEDDFRSSF